ncbi:MAG: hypothetical protein JWM52_192 [Candidatus Saccharibacteria bacterium]|nr:hypothetical protein [Candidatus Saccharibacteria bacterium]
MNPSQDPVPSEPTPEVPVTPPTSETPVTPVVSTPVGPTAVNPGKTLGIVSLILSIIGVGVVGIILGAIGLNKSKKAGLGNGLALAGIIVGAISTVLGILFFSLILIGASSIVKTCNDLGPGTHTTTSGTVITCGS